jgi:amino acid transporter
MLGVSTASAISMLLLIGSVFWLSAYTVSSLNVILFRRRQPKTPRTFKVPGGYIIPVIALLGNLFMMYNISADPVERLTIYKTVAVVFAGFAIYAGIWCRMVMKIPLFRPVPIKTIMAMENELYYVVRHPEHRKN